MKRSVAIVAVVFVVFASYVAWHLWGPSKVPEGQPALVSLAPANFAEFQRQFNDNPNKVRGVLLLSPT